MEGILGPSVVRPQNRWWIPDSWKFQLWTRNWPENLEDMAGAFEH